MKNVKRTAKKAVAVLSSFAVIMSCSTAGLLTVSAADTKASTLSMESSAYATKMNIYDENGKDISSNPIIYLDNSTAAGGNTDTTIKVKIGNDSGICDDTIVCAKEAFPEGQEKIRFNSVSYDKDTMTLNISALSEPDSQGKQKPLKTGTTKISFSTESGEVYRNLTVVVYEPATDMKVYFQDKATQVGFDSGNVGGVMTVANHKYQFYATPVETTSTDVVEWNVYDGTYNGSGTPRATTKAEISNDGLFTPKTNGVVTIEAKYKATETSPRKFARGNVKIGNTTVVAQTVPKYIQVVIVKENPAKAMQITNAPEAMEANETCQLDLKKVPTYTGSGYETGATDEITWVSSNTKVATVDSKGLVKALSKGDVTITAYAENQTVYAECQIRVLTKATAVSITPSPTSTRVGIGAQLIATMQPASANDEIVWTSSNPSIAKVESTTVGEFGNSQTAVVTGVKTGQAIITAKAKNSGVEAKCTVTVNDKILSDNLKLTITDGDVINTVAPNSTVSLYTNQDVTIDAALTAADGSTPDDTINWQVSGNENAYVTIPSKTTKSIRLHGVSEGTVTVKAYSEARPKDIYQIFKVNVLRCCDSVNMIDNGTGTNCGNKSLNVGDSFSLSADMRIAGNYPYNHSDTVKSWTSNNTDVATVSNTGVVTAVNNGTAAITVTTASGRKATCSINVFTTSQVIMNGVTASPDGVSLPTTSLALNKDGTGTKNLSAQVLNESGRNVSNVNLKWTSSDETVATVSNTGVITANSVGTTVITVKSGTKSDSCLLTVTAAVNQITYETLSEIVYSPTVSEYKPQPKVVFGNKVLTEGTDYTLEYSNNTKVGTAAVKVTGIGYYTGTSTLQFRIVAKQLTSPDVIISNIEDQQCTGKQITPELKVTCEGVTLTPNIDYTISWSNNVNVGTAAVNINGRGNYSGNVRKEFKIYCNHNEVTRVRVITNPTCSAEGKETVRCTACGTQFDRVIPMTEHKYKNTVIAPTEKTDGYTLHECTECGHSYKDNYVCAYSKTSITKCTVTLSSTVFTCNGRVQRPSVIVKYGSTVLKYNTDYTLVYSNVNSTEAGTYDVMVVGKNTYGGSVTKTYQINEPLANDSTISATSVTPGTEITLNAKATGGTAPYKYYYYYMAPNSSNWIALSASTSSTSRATKPATSGTFKYMVKIVDKANNTKSKTFNVEVKSATPLVNNSTISATTVAQGTEITLSAKAAGGTAPYKYYYYYKAPGSSNWVALSASTSAASRVTKPTTVGTFQYMVKIVDKANDSQSKTFNVNVISQLNNNSTISATTVTAGTTIRLTAKAAGGTTPYKYYYSYRLQGSSKWIALSASTSAKYRDTKPTAAGTYQYMIKVVDATGAAKSKIFTVKVNAPAKALVNTSTITSTSIKFGNSLTIYGNATGGTAPYKYYYYYKAPGSSKYIALSASETSKVRATKPTTTGTYYYSVKVVDAAGNYKIKIFTVNVH